jgi:hypothetical protein
MEVLTKFETPAEFVVSDVLKTKNQMFWKEFTLST